MTGVWIGIGLSLVALCVSLWSYFEVRDLRAEMDVRLALAGMTAAGASADAAASALRRALLIAETERQHTPTT